MFCVVFLQDLNKALDDASEKTRIAGDALLNLQDPSADMAAVRTQMDALSSRVHALKGKMTRFEEHYDEHMRKATEFQLAVEQLLAKFAGRKEQLLAVEVDTTDGQAIKKRIEELEVSFANSLMNFLVTCYGLSGLLISVLSVWLEISSA